MPERTMAIEPAQLSHVLPLFAYLVLAAVLVSQRGRRRMPSAVSSAATDRPWWIMAALLTAGWAASVASAAQLTSAARTWTEILETLRTMGWMLLLVELAAVPMPPSSMPPSSKLALLGRYPVHRRSRAGLVLAAATLIAAQAWQAQSAIHILRLALAVSGLMLVEQLFRTAAPHARWGIRLACLGIGALFAYDVCLYADAVLLGRIDADIHAARGAANALSVPLLVLAWRRQPNWTARVQLSPRTAAHSVALLACGAYLTVMAAAAWCLRQAGGSWGPVMQLACLFGAVLVLLTVLGSGTMRARIKVFVAKHLYRGRYDYRNEWQRFTAGMAGAGNDLPHQTIEALARLVESPAGVLWLRSGADQFRAAACWNMAAPEAPEPADGVLCRLLGERAWVVETAAWCTTAGEGGGYRQPALPGWLGSASPFWVVTPLLLGTRLLGFVALAPARTPMTLDWEVRDMLVIAGRQAATALAHRESADSLAIARQFASFHRMSAFVAHDLKNVAGQLSLLLANAQAHRHDRAFQDDMLDTVQHALDKMTRLLARLGREETQADPVALRLDGLLSALAGSWSAMRPEPVLKVDEAESDSAQLWVAADAERLARVLGHLVQNAVEAAGSQGRVTVRLHCRHGMALIDVCDSGHGMSHAFVRDRLFQPFETTKATGMGIGVFESRVYLRELGGDLVVRSTQGVGTTFTASLPLVGAQAETMATTVENRHGP